MDAGTGFETLDIVCHICDKSNLYVYNTRIFLVLKFLLAQLSLFSFLFLFPTLPTLSLSLSLSPELKNE